MSLIGDMRSQITFRERVYVTDSIGGQTTTLQDIATNPTVWAKITPMKGIERFFAEKIEANIDYEIIIRRRTDIDTHNFVLYKGTEFEIRAILDVKNRHEFQKLLVLEGVGR